MDESYDAKDKSFLELEKICSETMVKRILQTLLITIKGQNNFERRHSQESMFLFAISNL